MKNKNLFIVILIALITIPGLSFAQGNIEVTPFGGYMFGGKFRFYEGELKIKDNPTYGLGLDFEIAPLTKVVLLWSHMNSTAEFRPYYGFDDLAFDPVDVNVGYIQIGTVREAEYGNVTPYGMMTIGTTYFIPKDSSGDDAWKFSAAIGGGAKIWLTDNVGIRLQGRLMAPMFWGGIGLSVGPGGTGLSVGASSSMLQGDLTGGLVFAF